MIYLVEQEATTFHHRLNVAGDFIDFSDVRNSTVCRHIRTITISDALVELEKLNICEEFYVEASFPQFFIARNSTRTRA